jgi:6-phosphogluconolactonase/glucosamine-6-phosphate isomerase/deaminase
VLQISGAGKAQVLQQALQAPNKARPVGLVLQADAANPSHTVSVWMGA